MTSGFITIVECVESSHLVPYSIIRGPCVVKQRKPFHWLHALLNYSILVYGSHANKHARLWLLSPLDPFLCHHLRYLVRQRTTSQTYNHRLASSIHCHMSTATTHIGSSCACSGFQSRVWSRFGKWFGQSKAVPVSCPKPIIPLFRAVVTVMAKWLYIELMAI